MSQTLTKTTPIAQPKETIHDKEFVLYDENSKACAELTVGKKRAGSEPVR